MHTTQIICAVLALVSYTSAKGNGAGAGGAGSYGGGSGGYGAGGGGQGSGIGGPAGYGGHGAGAGYGGGAGNGVGSGYGGAGSGYGAGQESLAPKPYAFNYEAPDESGNAHFRAEQADGSGSVQGSYGYTDTQGLYRKVDYVANAGGFKASVKTNEPGTDGKENPADVIVNAQPSPPGVQEKYSPSSAYGGAGGAHGGQGGYGGFGGAGGVGSGYGGGSKAGYGQGGAGGIGQGYGGATGGSGKIGGGSFSGIPNSSSGKSGY